MACWKYKQAASMCIGVAIAFVAVSLSTHVASPQTIDFYAQETVVTLTGTVAAEPDRRPMHTKYTLEVTQVRTASGTVQQGIRGKVLMSDYQNWPRYTMGDELTVRGTLQKPGAIDDFRYDNYLARFGIYAVMYRASVVESKRAPSLNIRAWLFAAKEHIEARINRLLPEPHASFMAGLLTGSRKGIPEEVLNSFQVTGLTHIIAISGFNITIIIALITASLFWLPPSKRLLPAILAIVVFTVFVGASAAVMRAAIMGILGMLVLHTNRLPNPRLLVAWTAFFMVVWNPKLLWYDAGFQLSFLAVVGLLELDPILKPLCKKLPETLAIRESFQMTLAAQLTAVPLIIVLFSQVSLIAPLANVLVAPAIPLAMLFGALAVVASFGFELLGLLMSSLAWLCLEWILIMAKALAAVPYASVKLHMPHWALVVYYILLATTRYTALRLWSPKATLRA